MSRLPASPIKDRLARRPALLGAGLVGLVVVLVGALFLWLEREPGTAPEAEPASESNRPPLRDLTTMNRDETARLRRLRNEALECMGWAAGNSFRKQMWPEVESYVGQRGLYFDFMLRLAPPGLSEDLNEAELEANRARYEDAFVRGRGASLDEAEIARCIARTREISNALERMLERERGPPAIDSPISIEQ